MPCTPPRSGVWQVAQPTLSNTASPRSARSSSLLVGRRFPNGAGKAVHEPVEGGKLLVVEVGWATPVAGLSEGLGLGAQRGAEADLVGTRGGDELLQGRELGPPAELAHPAVREDAQPTSPPWESPEGRSRDARRVPICRELSLMSSSEMRSIKPMPNSAGC